MWNKNDAFWDVKLPVSKWVIQTPLVYYPILQFLFNLIELLDLLAFIDFGGFLDAFTLDPSVGCAVFF